MTLDIKDFYIVGPMGRWMDHIFLIVFLGKLVEQVLSDDSNQSNSTKHAGFSQIVELVAALFWTIARCGTCHCVHALPRPLSVPTKSLFRDQQQHQHHSNTKEVE